LFWAEEVKVYTSSARFLTLNESHFSALPLFDGDPLSAGTFEIPKRSSPERFLLPLHFLTLFATSVTFFRRHTFLPFAF